ncbi:MAG: hypothetical protein A2X64_02990 [Ignavibacteria bacterium GWF2_33_9]|nr:MAG: hypothetical protein A2X64_02990 [Ignavibacteria bacterium GWF2_33_9]
MPIEFNLKQELQKFTFSNKIKVQFGQVDAIGILYNIQYFSIFENGRTNYLQNLNFINNLKDFVKFPVMTVAHSIDYFNPAEFLDEIEIFTRVSQIGNSSIVFESLAVKNNDLLLSKLSSTYVYIDLQTRKSISIPEFIKQKFLDFENGNVILTNGSNEKN